MMLYVVIFFPSKLASLVLPVVQPIVGRGADAVRQRLKNSSGDSGPRSPAAVRHHEVRQRFENNI